MIEPFEAALADLLADRVGGDAAVEAVFRPRDGLAPLDDDAARVLVRVADGRVPEEVGVDRLERLDRTRERATLRLAGRVRIDVQIGAGSGPAAQRQREVLWRAADAVLVALNDDDVRSGRVWGDAHEQGFAIDRFRCEEVREALPPALPDHHHLEIGCGYEGRFWPVVAVAEGGVIRAPIRTRIVVGDLESPSGLRVPSGGGELVVGVRVDLRALGLAQPRLLGRLLGAEPPGSLVGEVDDVPEGAVAYSPDPDGVFRVRFQPAAPPAAGLATAVLSLASAEAPTVSVGRLQIEVTAP